LPKPSWASATILVAIGLLAGGCAAGGEDTGGATLTVYVSLPLHGPSGPDGKDAADGARMALADAGSEAGGVAITAEYLDDTDGSGDLAGWTPAAVSANARLATQDTTAIAYLGDFESGATRASLPVTNSARMLQVSPASGAEDLVAPVPGSDEVPDVQASGTRTFGRVIPADRTQALAGAAWVDRMGVDRVATESDGTAFGDSMVSGFEDGLRRARTAPAGGFLYYGGLPDNQPLADARDVELMVTDAELEPGVSEPAGTFATSAALDPTQLPPKGKEFADAFRAKYGRAPGRYAAYGYEAMAAILDSIDRASDPEDRADVIDAFFATADRHSVLGTYSIDEVGDTTLDRMTGYRLNGRAGRATPIQPH
jgi:branched-chain amino acid transport system substrate-binding protein